MNDLASIFIVGAGATAVADLWGIARKPLLGVAPPDYGLVGRWFAHMGHGQFRHDSISKSRVMPGERFIGWTVHYMIGIAYAALLIAIFGRSWLQMPTLGPALATGIGTVAAPFLVMQPAMGMGVAASRAPRPASARLQSLVMHLAFGMGLYLAALALPLLGSR